MTDKHLLMVPVYCSMCLHLLVLGRLRCFVYFLNVIYTPNHMTINKPSRHLYYSTTDFPFTLRYTSRDNHMMDGCVRPHARVGFSPLSHDTVGFFFISISCFSHHKLIWPISEWGHLDLTKTQRRGIVMGTNIWRKVVYFQYIYYALLNILNFRRVSTQIWLNSKLWEGGGCTLRISQMPEVIQDLASAKPKIITPPPQWFLSHP